MTPQPHRHGMRRLWAAPLLTAALVLLASTPAFAQSPPMLQGRLDALAQSAVQSDTPWGALWAALEIGDIIHSLPAQQGHAWLLKLAVELEKEQTESAWLAAAALREEALWISVETGQTERAQDEARGLGLLDAWQIIGPFENANMAGFDMGYAPEGLYNPDAAYDGKVTRVSWTPSKPNARRTARMGDALNPDNSVVGYAATAFEVPRTTKAVLRLEISNAHKVWLNGQLVVRAEANTKARFDGTAHGVTLKRGRNTLMIKLARENSGFASLRARLTDTKGRPLVLKSAVVPDKALLASPKPHKGAFEVADPVKASAASAQSPLATIEAATIARELHPDDPQTPWRDLADKAIEGAPKDADILFMASKVLPGHWRQLQLVRAASDADPNDHWIKLRLGRKVEQSVGLSHTTEALAITDAILSKVEGPSKTPALLPRLFRSQIYRSLAMNDSALLVLEPLIKAYPDNPRLLRELGEVYSALGQFKSSREMEDALLKDRPMFCSRVRTRANRFVSAGMPQEASTLLRSLRSKRPDCAGTSGALATVLHALGRTDEAIGVLDEALAFSPNNKYHLSQKAYLLETAGRLDEALAAYEQAMLVAPQDRSLAERVKALQPDEASFETAWRWDESKLVPEPDAAKKYTGQDYYYIGQQTIVHVAPSGKATRFVQNIVHVLNDEGAKAWGDFRAYYSPGFERIEVVSVRVRKPNGLISEAYQRQDYDAGRGSGNLYYLRRFAYLDIPALEPGDVVEYTYREFEVGDDNFREGYFGDIWFFESGVDTEHARYVVMTPKSMPLYDRAPSALANFKREVSTASYKDTPHNVHSYEATQIARVQTDKSMPGRSEVFEYVLVSSYQTWEQVGQWWWNLIKDQLIIDAEIRDKALEVTKGLKDDRARVEAIYNWVVENTRYVGIEFGVHGWKPYRTTLCMRRRFGDCKDKASLIKVMLEAVGIEANMVLIRTRRLGNVAEAPANLAIFNHAIAYVPSLDLFLDGTAEFHGSSELPFSDQGQFAVIVADGGKVTVKRPEVNTPDLNKHMRVLDVDLSGDEPVVRGELRAEGMDAPWYRRRFDSKDKRQERLQTAIARVFPGAKLIEQDFVEVEDLEKPVLIKFVFTGGGFVRRSGDTRLLFAAGRQFRLLDSYAPRATRDQDLALGVPATYTNKVSYLLPDDRKVARWPEPITRKGPFGSYTVGCEERAGRVECEVSYAIAVERVKEEDYAAFRAWLTELDQAVNQPIELKTVKED